MYYNIRSNSILNAVPPNGYLQNGVLVQGLNLTDQETQKSCGIYIIKSDTPAQPDHTTEDISQRQVDIEEDGVIITRTWIALPEPETVIPDSISPRQIRLWFIQNGIPLSNVENAINSIENNILRESTLVEWEYSPYVERNHPMINTLGAILGLTPEQIDQAFVEASQI